jgi:hypothetical protein
VIGEEIHKLLAARFIKELFHPKWLANPVLVKKRMVNEECALITLVSIRLAPSTHSLYCASIR